MNEVISMGPDIKTVIQKIDNPFWANVISAWAKFSKHFKPQNSHEILCQPLWGNPFIKLNFIRPWYKKGIHFIKDIIHMDNGKIKDMVEIKAEYDVNMTFLDYNRLKKAIPLDWLNTLENHNHPQFPCILPQLQSVLYVKKGCGPYNRILSQESSTALPSQIKWSQELSLTEQNGFNKSKWQKIYKLPFITTLDANLRYFQHKILKRFLPTNKYLKKINIKDNSSCTFCGCDEETLIHLFVKCEFVTSVWIELQKWLVSCGYIHLQSLEPSDIILGNPEKDIIFNFILIIAKYVIYRSKITNRYPSFAAVKAYLKYVKDIEKYIASTNNTLDKFYGKWASVFHKLQ